MVRALRSIPMVEDQYRLGNAINVRLMEPTEMVLVMQILKNLLNTLILPVTGPWRNSVSSYSILILVFTDLSITVFLGALWISAWPLALGLDVVSLRFLTFQSGTYNALLLLLPGLILSEALCSEHRTISPLPCLLFTFLCWLLGASYGVRNALWKPRCFEQLDPGSHPFPSLSIPDYTLPWISLLVTACYACSLVVFGSSVPGVQSQSKRLYCTSALQRLVWSIVMVCSAAFLAGQSPFCGLNTILICSLHRLGVATGWRIMKLKNADEDTTIIV